MALERCPWALKEEMWSYHDTEWGVPVHDDEKHFEFLVLEGAQAGLSWSTVLKRREGYRKAFKNFDAPKVARFSAKDVARLMNDSGIIRNRLKIESTVKNAKAFLKVQEELGSFDQLLWSFFDGKSKTNRWRASKQIPATSKESDEVSRELKRRGFTFVGSTIMYAHLQACGLVNDHLVSCFRYRAV
jgi:DNA-3-methyladenine glycosylase I